MASDDDSVSGLSALSSDDMGWESDKDDGYWAALDDMAVASLGGGSPPRRRIRSRIKSSLSRTTAEMKTKLSSLKEKLKQARYRKLRDKVGFTAGITNFGFTCFFVGAHPELFPYFYVLKSIVLLSYRLFDYRRQKAHYFLFDYCYVINLLTCLYCTVLPSPLLFSLVFAAANGPLLLAIIAWRNSLVFHSLDKMTSILIHLTPAVVTFTVRHTPDSPWPTSDSATWTELVGGGIVLYMLWQAMYYVKVEVWSKEKVEERGYDTSFRHLSTAKSGMGKLVRRFPEPYRVFGFMFMQLVYTFITMLPCVVLYNSRTLHFLWIVFLTIFSAWNGSSYMFSVFASRYQAQLEALEAQHQLQLQSEKK